MDRAHEWYPVQSICLLKVTDKDQTIQYFRIYIPYFTVLQYIRKTIRPMSHKIRLGFQDRSYLNPVFFRGIIKMYCLFAKLFVIAKEIRKPLTNLSTNPIYTLFQSFPCKPIKLLVCLFYLHREETSVCIQFNLLMRKIDNYSIG